MPRLVIVKAFIGIEPGQPRIFNSEPSVTEPKLIKYYYIDLLNLFISSDIAFLNVETWKFMKVLKKKIESYELCLHRRILNIALDHINNKEVLRGTHEEKDILFEMIKRKLEYF